MSLTTTANPPRWQSAALWVVRGLLALAFASAGCAKFYGVPMLVEEFQHIGLGEWFRYFTGSLEILGAILLLVPSKAAFGALLLICIMVGAIIAHLFVVGGSPVPAVVLLVLSAVVAYAKRDHFDIILHARQMTGFRRPMLAVVLFGLAFAVPMCVTLALTGACAAVSDVPKVVTHRLAFQVNSDDTTVMKHAITNALNAVANYREKQEPVAIEIVAYGAGVHMFRADTSPVKGLLQLLRANHPDAVFSVCGNTKTIMETKEGHPLSFVDGARVVPAGVVRLVELQEAGWSYLRP